MSPDPPSLSRTLLIDTEVCGSWLIRQLTRAGLNTDLAVGWPAAHALLKAGSYHTCVIVADLEQPADLVHLGELRRRVPGVWLVVLSHLQIKRALPLARAQGADAVLAEPFSMRDLILRLSALSVRSRPTF